ncbi:MAG: HNH endonuclease [Caulobacterales bacterium]|nr:HNH endonuclease [Caulobacterales bacterium]MCA0372712.1 HNH endonuclease [Pseudomonadota bacterium]
MIALQQNYCNEAQTQNRVARRAGNGHPVLVLNADYRPLSYFPLSLWSWQDAIKAIILDRVQVVAEYDEYVHSPSHTIRLPSVISLKEYVRQDRSLAFTRFNLFLRDGFKCLYCGSGHDLTFDHVIPRAYGGKTCWENIVTACSKCNAKKGGRTPKEARMELRHPPHRPNLYELQTMGRKFPPNYLHDTWLDWLYWDIELEA